MKNSDQYRSVLKSQFNTTWSLLEYHFRDLTDDECLWKPCENGIYVNLTDYGWVADYPVSEEYEIGPPNIAWLTWHIKYWWSMVFDSSFDSGTLRREDVLWGGNAKAAINDIRHLRESWLEKLDILTDEELASTTNVKFPFENRTFLDLAAWLNLELMKNASEIGYCRFLYANRFLLKKEDTP